MHAAAITVFREEEEAIAATADDSFAPTAGAFVVVLPAFVAAAVVVVGVVESPAAPPGISVLFKSSMAPSGAPSGFVPAPGFIVPFVLMSTLMLTTKSVLLPSKPKPATARHVVTFVPIFSKFVGLKDNRLGGAGSVSQTLSPSKMYLLKVIVQSSELHVLHGRNLLHIVVHVVVVISHRRSCRSAVAYT